VIVEALFLTCVSRVAVPAHIVGRNDSGKWLFNSRFSDFSCKANSDVVRYGREQHEWGVVVEEEQPF
jgi:hypothetical protein